jgi:hypothetical protein
MPMQLHKSGESWTMSNLDITPNSVRVRMKNPDMFVPGSFRTIDIDAKRGIKSVVGKIPGSDSMVLQNYIFENWKPQDVLTWLKANVK